MTDNEAIEVLKQPCYCDYDLSATIESCEVSSCDKRDATKMAIEALQKVQQFEAIGTIDEFKALKEKSVSKKVVAISLTHEGRVGNCPNCNNFVAENYDKNCQKCRWELDWS